jgi:methylated-DNA-[protein]-cysteine S-methyltransferase
MFDRNRARYAVLDSPIGPLLLVGNDAGLRQVGFQAGPHPLAIDPGWQVDNDFLREAARQIGAYFAGERRAFDLPLAPEGTAFQLAVWMKLREIPYGGTISYGDLARRVGNPKASRAVGAANGRNPLPIVVPCHRVIGSGGQLTGFGGGLPIKAQLLALERRVLGHDSPSRS